MTNLRHAAIAALSLIAVFVGLLSVIPGEQVVYATDPTVDAAAAIVAQATARAQEAARQTADARTANEASQRATAAALDLQIRRNNATETAAAVATVQSARATTDARTAKEASQRETASALEARIQSDGATATIVAVATAQSVSATSSALDAQIKVAGATQTAVYAATTTAIQASATREAYTAQQNSANASAFLGLATQVALIALLIALIVWVFALALRARKRAPVRVEIVEEPELVRVVEPSVPLDAPEARTRIIPETEVVTGDDPAADRLAELLESQGAINVSGCPVTS